MALRLVAENGVPVRYYGVMTMPDGTKVAIDNGCKSEVTCRIMMTLHFDHPFEVVRKEAYEKEHGTENVYNLKDIKKGGRHG